MKSKETFDLLNGNNTFNNHEETRKTKSEKEGKEKDGQKVQSEIPFPEYNVRRSNNLQGEGVPESVFSDRIKSFENRLPKLKPGEFSYVERVFTEKGHFGYFAPERIDSLEDVAYIFNKLEDEAVENSFAVYVKNKLPVVQHLGIGNFSSVPVNVPAVIEGARRIKPDKIYFVHNHPSGTLIPSESDRKMYRILKTVLKDKLMDAIIINLRSGKYSTFNLDENHIAYKNPGREGVPVRIFAFDRQVFEKNFNPETASQLTSSADVAAFISSHRLGKRDKLSFLILNRSLKIMGNFFTPQTMLTPDNVEKVANYMASRVITHGGESVITYGTARVEPAAINRLKKLLSLSEINLLDAITVKNSEVISYADEGILAENPGRYFRDHALPENGGNGFQTTVAKDKASLSSESTPSDILSWMEQDNGKSEEHRIKR